MSPGYRINTIIILFNIFDTIGRKAPGIFSVSKKSFYYLAFARITFFFTFVLIVALENTYLMSVFNIFIFSQLD
jgi:hypothetical protein